MFRDEVNDVIGDGHLESIQLCLLLQDCNPVLEIGQADISYHSPLKPTHEPGFKACDFRWWPVTGQYDLTTGFIKGIEGMEELFLGRFFSPFQKVHVIDKQ